MWLRKVLMDSKFRAWTTLEKIVDAKLLRLSDQLQTRLLEADCDSGDQGRVISHHPLRDPGNRFTALQIGITDLCNLVCRHCGRYPKQSDLLGTIPLAVFAKYLSRFSPDWFDELLVSDWGEPTIVPNLLDYLYLAKRSGWDKVQFVTNGTNKDEAFLDEIIAQRLVYQMIVSIEAADPKLYEHIRGARFTRFSRFVRDAARVRELYESSMILSFSVTCMKENLEELHNIVKLAADMKIDRIYMVHIQPYTAGEVVRGKLCVPTQRLDSVDRKSLLHVFHDVIDCALSNNILLMLPEPFPEITGDNSVMVTPPSRTGEVDSGRRVQFGAKYKCVEPFRWVQLDYMGNVYPCCRIKKDLYCCGNINNLDFYSICHNLKYEKLRQSLQHGGEPLECCGGCGVLEGKTL